MLTHRGLLVHPHELDAQWLNTCASLGLNVIGLHPPGGVRANETLQSLLDLHREPGFRALLRQAGAMGLVVEYEMHALSWLVPRSMAAEHPDWFRMDEAGRRVADFNLCPSSREAMAYLTARAEELARLLPAETHRYYFWPDDVSKARCHCPACEGLSASDQQLMLVHAMLAGVRRADPAGTMPFLAYLDTREPPVHVQPQEGVFLEFAPIHRRADRPIGDPGCAENAAETAHLQELLALFGAKNAQVLEYWLDNSLYSGWEYPPKAFATWDDIMAQDVQYYSGLGFERITTFACYLGEDYRKLHGEPDLSGYGRALALAEVE